ncbi:DUF4252 domain-containing protein [Botrimarina hoheduenensis]|uniref:DUF4252 domain-containing protein n=1 Tax=Botrimarina hoheduenensis TaxID=2528000 RepID=A0A5C5W7R2_9BACT|nr:DUF4252 domain-containing protein [Botrimarina hoheduenensis]TWT46750.1 hypothetical protein Pla111_18510 [Botrimarina hoheduenensis]
MSPRKRCLAALFAAVTLPATVALAEDVNHPGVVTADWLSEVAQAEPKAKVELSGPVLRLLTAATGKAAKFGALVDQLKLVRVMVYEGLDKNLATSSQAIDHATRLQSAGWQSIVRVRDGDDESVDVMVLPRGQDEIAGIVVLVAEPGELVFVNIAGDLNAEEFGSHFGRLLGPLVQGDLDIEDLLEAAEEDHPTDGETLRIP